jgi:hypothetical protein
MINFFMNIYSGMVEEHTAHSLEDSVKNIECNVAALWEESCHYENASLETLKKFAAYGVQIIETKVTLSKTMIHDRHRWKNMEMRSAQIPRTWDDRLLVLEFLELLATLYVRQTSDCIISLYWQVLYLYIYRLIYYMHAKLKGSYLKNV